MRRRRYFTFLELAIAITITLMVSLALFAYSHNVSKSWEQINEEKKRIQEILNMDRSISAVLANAIPFTWTSDQVEEDGTGDTFPFIVADEHTLRIAYLHDLHDATEGAIRFAQFVVQDENLYLTYSDRPFYQWDDLGGRDQTVLLAEQIQQITFQYLDWSADEDADWEDRVLWLDQWETDDSERTDIPLAIQMTVEWTNGKTLSWYRRTMGNSFRERFGQWTPLEDDKR